MKTRAVELPDELLLKIVVQVRRLHGPVLFANTSLSAGNDATAILFALARVNRQWSRVAVGELWRRVLVGK